MVSEYDGCSEGERRVLASRGIGLARPTLSSEPKPKLPPRFYVGMALAVIFVCVLAVIGAVTVAVLAALWVKGWAL